MKIESFTYFFPEAPRLMSVKSPLFEIMSRDPKYVAEKKYNGSRLQLHVKNGFEFWNRHECRMNYSPSSEVIKALKAVRWPQGYCLLDGELRHNKVVGVKHKIVFYDVFIWDGMLLTGLTFKERRGFLENTIPPDCGQTALSIPYRHDGGFVFVFNEAIKDPEIEGLVIKNVNGRLNLSRTGNASSTWMWKVREGSGRYRF